MNRYTVTLLILFSISTNDSLAQRNYLDYVLQFAERMIEVPKDTFGGQIAHLWPGVINIKENRMPTLEEQVVPTPGTRPHDRAVWGSNYYHDLSTIKCFQILTGLTGDLKYLEEIKKYTHDFLKYCQNPETGLLGWGEHLYYHFHYDSVSVDDAKSDRARYHEFLAATPNWDYLWQVDSLATRKAIEGLLFHFRGYLTTSYLFNRHAHWDVYRPESTNWQRFQFMRDGQPWIKHSGLLAYSFAFLYSKTQEQEWLDWARGVGTLYWRHRNPETNLTVSCIDDQRPHTQLSGLQGSSSLAYWLLKTQQFLPEDTTFKHMALEYMEALKKYHWSDSLQNFLNLCQRNGAPSYQEPAQVISTGYSNASLLTVGRKAAYITKQTNHLPSKEVALRCLQVADQAQLPDQFVINSAAELVHFYLDLYQLDKNPSAIEQAQKYADRAIETLWRDDWFARQTDDPYYEAKVGTGDLILGLLRLHLTVTKHPLESEVDWSF